MSKKNFKVTSIEDGKEYWISRAHAVVGVIIDDECNFLLERRGNGCPDYVGKLAFPCGYLDWGETRLEAVKREIFEELGIALTPENSTIVELNTVDDPKADARENIVTRYIICYPNLKNELDNIRNFIKSTDERGGESEEVSEVVLFSAIEAHKLDDTEFAFNHKDLIEEILNSKYIRYGESSRDNHSS